MPALVNLLASTRETHTPQRMVASEEKSLQQLSSGSLTFKAERNGTLGLSNGESDTGEAPINASKSCIYEM